MEKEIYPSIYRRLKSNALVRSLVAPIRLTHQSFILPLFVEENLPAPRYIEFMHGTRVETKNTIFSAIDHALSKGIAKFLLFPIPAGKTDHPKDFSFASGLIHMIKSRYGDAIWLASDVCLCSYTTHGHCGIMDLAHSKVMNTESVHILTLYALELAGAGVDCLAPSDMMDGRIKAIRKALEIQGYDDTVIMSYSSKFSSQWYGPFRDACHSSPAKGILKDRKTYQLSPYNKQEAINCALRDESEGADILMVKPAGLYIDIIQEVKSQTKRPLAAYQVSGEYAAIEQMAHIGMVDRSKAHLEAWSAIARSGADIIISYAAHEAKAWINDFEY
jgi:porphobilinogen synthase